MKKILLTVYFFFFLVVLLSNSALATPIVFSGYDQGSASLATSPNSNSAAAAFDVATITSFVDFESSLPSDVTITGGNIQNTTPGAAEYYGYNTTTGGSNFLYVLNGSVIFDFSTPISAFGAYFTGWQTGNPTLSYVDNTTVTLNMPAANRVFGGTIFYGFTDFGASITRITYNTADDIVSVDDIRYGNPIPEPTTILLSGLGLIGMGAYIRRHRNKMN